VKQRQLPHDRKQPCGACQRRDESARTAESLAEDAQSEGWSDRGDDDPDGGDDGTGHCERAPEPPERIDDAEGGETRHGEERGEGADEEERASENGCARVSAGGAGRKPVSSEHHVRGGDPSQPDHGHHDPLERSTEDEPVRRGNKVTPRSDTDPREREDGARQIPQDQREEHGQLGIDIRDEQERADDRTGNGRRNGDPPDRTAATGRVHLTEWNGRRH
jgi:hypothetical protein